MATPTPLIKDEDGTIADLPVAQATPVGGATPSFSNALVVASPAASVLTTVDLEVGSKGTYLLAGSPVQVEKLDSPRAVSGLYVHSIQIGADLEVFHLKDATRVMQLLDANVNSPRQLRLSPKPPVLNLQNGFYYDLLLPMPATLDHLQVTLQGFPPRIMTVAPTSPVAGKLHPRQVVTEVRIPGKPTLSEQTPGFTSYRVQQELVKAATIPGIHLVVREELVNIKKKTGSEKPFDDCVIM